MFRYLLIGAAICLTLGVMLGGGNSFGRLSLALGLPALAERLFSDDGWRGIAVYRQGDFARAATLSRQDKGGDFNTGVAFARAGQYAAALEAFDRAKARHPNDAQAHANFDLIASIYAGLELDPDSLAVWGGKHEDVVAQAPVGLGSARAASTGDEVTNSGPSGGLPELISVREQSVRKVFDDRFMLANDRWLKTLADVPGEYLAARIGEEYKRRKALGLLQPEPEDPR